MLFKFLFIAVDVNNFMNNDSRIAFLNGENFLEWKVNHFNIRVIDLDLIFMQMNHICQQNQVPL